MKWPSCSVGDTVYITQLSVHIEWGAYYVEKGLTRRRREFWHDIGRELKPQWPDRTPMCVNRRTVTVR